MKILWAVLLVGLATAFPYKRQENTTATDAGHTMDVDMDKAIQPEPKMEFIIAQAMKFAKAQAYFAALDSDLDGELSREEYVTGIMGFDKNGDGQLTEKEFADELDAMAKQIEQVLLLDTDGDGQVSVEELIAFLGANAPKPDEDKTPEQMTDEVRDAAAREINRRASLKRTINRRQAKEKGEDRKGRPDSGKRPMKEKTGENKPETPNEEEMNDPSKVDIEDIEDEVAFLNVTDAILFFIAMDVNQDGVVTPDEVDQTFTEMDSSGDGKLQEGEFLMNFGMLSALVAMFHDIDVDDDGFLSGQEVLRAAVHKPVVMRMVAEENARKVRQQNTDARRKKRFAQNLALLDSELMASYNITIDDILFQVYDVNGDGVISKEEYVMIFLAKDRNHDGVLTKEELSGAFNGIIELVRGFLMADTNFDGLISIREFVAAAIANGRKMLAGGEGDIQVEEAGPAAPEPETPGTEEETPGTEPETPGTEPETPGTEEETPSTEEETPGTEEETPGTEPETPGTEEETPGTEPETPGSEDTAATGDSAQTDAMNDFDAAIKRLFLKRNLRKRTQQ